MALFNGKGGVIAKATAVVTLITGILVLNWNVTDRVRAGDEKFKKEAVKEAVATAKAEDNKIWTAQNDQHQKSSLRFWMQQRELAKIELKRIRRGLRHHPNDPDLTEDKEYWEEIKRQAQRELDKILNP